MRNGNHTFVRVQRGRNFDFLNKPKMGEENRERRESTGLIIPPINHHLQKLKRKE